MGRKTPAQDVLEMGPDKLLPAQAGNCLLGNVAETWAVVCSNGSQRVRHIGAGLYITMTTAVILSQESPPRDPIPETPPLSPDANSHPLLGHAEQRWPKLLALWSRNHLCSGSVQHLAKQGPAPQLGDQGTTVIHPSMITTGNMALAAACSLLTGCKLSTPTRTLPRL